MGVTSRQELMIELSSHGLSQAEIARVLGVSRNSVNAAFSHLFPNMGEDRVREAKIAQASEELRDAVLKQGGHR
ncbi:MAG: LuxR C-terminal-related transcriptional regulator [Pseudomonadota bacterium]